MSVYLICKMLYRKCNKRKFERTFKIKSMLNIIKKMHKDVKYCFNNRRLYILTKQYFNVSDEVNKSFDNRVHSIIDNFYDFHLKEERRLFLNNSFDCTRFLNNKLTFSNDTVNSFQQITSNIFLFFI